MGRERRIFFPCPFFIDIILQLLYTLTVLSVLIQLRKGT